MSPSTKTPQSAAERRSAEAQLKRLVAALAPAHLRLVGTVRRRLRTRLPSAYELVYEYSDCVVISYSPTEHGIEGVLALRASADEVRLYLNSAKGLRDPEKRLQGAATTRWIVLEGASTLARPAVVDLVDQAIARNRVPFARTGRGPVVIRPGAASKRRGRRPA